MLGSSIVVPEYLTEEGSKALNIKYPNAKNNDAIVVFGPGDGIQTLVYADGYWLIYESGKTDKMFTPQRIIDDQTKSVVIPSVGVTTATSVNAGQLALIGLLGFLLLRGAIK